MDYLTHSQPSTQYNGIIPPAAAVRHFSVVNVFSSSPVNFKQLSRLERVAGVEDVRGSRFRTNGRRDDDGLFRNYSAKLGVRIRFYYTVP